MSRAKLRTEPAAIETLGGRIYRARVAKGLSQSALGVAAGLAPKNAGNTVSRWETNAATPSDLAWPKLAETLGVSRADLEKPPLRAGEPAGSRSAVREPSPGEEGAAPPYGAGRGIPTKKSANGRLTPGTQGGGQITDDLDGRSVDELLLLLEGARIGGATPERQLEFAHALERALDRERKGTK